MNGYAVIVLCASLYAIVIARPEVTTYTNKYDNADLQQILNSERLLTNYYNCLNDGATCPPDGAELRKVLPEALKNKCASCTDKQKEQSKMVVNFILEHKPDWFKTLESKYDPTGEFRKEYGEEAKKNGVNL